MRGAPCLYNYAISSNKVIGVGLSRIMKGQKVEPGFGPGAECEEARIYDFKR